MGNILCCCCKYNEDKTNVSSSPSRLVSRQHSSRSDQQRECSHNKYQTFQVSKTYVSSSPSPLVPRRHSSRSDQQRGRSHKTEQTFQTITDHFNVTNVHSKRHTSISSVEALADVSLREPQPNTRLSQYVRKPDGYFSTQSAPKQRTDDSSKTIRKAHKTLAAIKLPCIETEVQTLIWKPEAAPKQRTDNTIKTKRKAPKTPTAALPCDETEVHTLIWKDDSSKTKRKALKTHAATCPSIWCDKTEVQTTCKPPARYHGYDQHNDNVTTRSRTSPSSPKDDVISEIGTLVERILSHSRDNFIPTELYNKLLKACLKAQRQPLTSQRYVSNHLQRAKELWEEGTETRVAPSKFLSHILKALKKDPREGDTYMFIGLYLWEMFAELRLAKKFLELAYQLQQDSETCSYIVDLCMVLQDKKMALDILSANIQISSSAEWAYLRMGLLLSSLGDHVGAENWFQTAIPHSSTGGSDRQPYECLARHRLQTWGIEHARQAFLNGSQFQSAYGRRQSSNHIAKLEAANLRAMYSDSQQWINQSGELGVQFAFSLLFAICPDLLRPVGFDFQRVHLARRAITDVYMKGGLMRMGKRIDWSEADKQCSYMLRFFLIHCQFVPDLLASSLQIQPRFPQGNHLRVCCVGGGPGSDIIGLLIYLRTIGRCARLTCHVLDKFPTWRNVWDHVQPRLPPPSVEATYSSIDTTSSGPLDRDTEEIIAQADIITFVKSVSPIIAFLKNSWNAIHQGVIPSILRSLKRGALVIYIDNSYGDQNSMFQNMATSNGLVQIHTYAWKCDIEALTTEFDAVWSQYRYNACPSCNLKGFIFYKQ